MYKTYEFDLARDAIRYIIRTCNIKKMHIPYYLCDVVRHTLVEEGCKPVFYHIDDDFYPDTIFPDNEFILYPNYWGVCGKNVDKLVKVYPNIIIDNAHAYYDKPKGAACFNAGHKFGYKKSVLWLNSTLSPFLDIQSVPSEINYDHTKIYNAELRKNIFLKLHQKYNEINLLNLDLNSVPFCYPCLLNSSDEADNLVLKLKKEGKIVYRYWRYLPKSYNEYKFYSRLVPIPILPH